MIIISAKFIISLFKIFILKVFNYKIVFCDCSRIGGYYDLIWHKRTKQTNKIHFILFAPNQKIANKYFNKIIEEEFDIKYENYNYLIYRIIQKLKINSHLLNIVPDNYFMLKEVYSNKSNTNYPYQKNLLIDNFNYPRQKINFENQILLRHYQLKKNNYITFHARDDNYLNTIYSNKTWHQHDYRDSNIDNYSHALNLINSVKKLKGVRTGKFVKKKILNNDVIIDYSSSNKYSDVGELFLIYNSKLFLCSDTGAAIFAEYIKKPIVYVNWCFPLRIHRWSSNSLFIFKKIFSVEFNKFLSIKETFHINPFKSDFNSCFKVFDNTPEEIRDALNEQLLRLDGEWKSSEEDIFLQKKFWKLFGDYDYSRETIFIGSSFLKNNKYLLN